MKDVILKRIAAHDGEWGWYQLERFINARDLPPGKTVMSLLNELKKDGPIVQVRAEYQLTDKGKAQAESIDG